MDRFRKRKESGGFFSLLQEQGGIRYEGWFCRIPDELPFLSQTERNTEENV